MVVIANLRSCNLKVVQQLTCVASILCGNHIHALQNGDRPEGHVLQVADRGLPLRKELQACTSIATLLVCQITLAIIFVALQVWRFKSRQPRHLD